MRRVILFLATLLAVAAPAAAVNTRFSQEARSIPTVSKPVYAFWLCDTEAGMPTTGLSEGDTAYSKDTDRFFTWNGAAWVQVGGSGGSGLTHPEVMVRVSWGGF